MVREEGRGSKPSGNSSCRNGREPTDITPKLPTRLQKPAEAAEELAISPRTLWSLTDSGSIPCVRIGRSVRYDPADLRRYVDAQKEGGESR